MTKLWKDIGMNKEIEKFTVGDDFQLDKNLIFWDVIGSFAHAIMLMKIGILTEEELRELKAIFTEIISLNKAGKFTIKRADEDVHTAIENFITKRLNNTGKKIHTGRSRNDQVLVDIRLYSKEKILEIEKAILELCTNLLSFSEENKNTPMPGYTHMQRAMPSSVGLWSSSFIESLLDDLKLLKEAFDFNDQSPLGSVASYGTSLNIDRQLVSDLLGFKQVQNNVLYVGNSRGKIEAIILNALVQVMLTLNKIASDLMLFTTQEFDFFQLPREFCTGSSVMPNKNNPDVLELIRAKAHVVQSYLFQVYGIVHDLPSGYNRDLQLTKKPLMEAFEITISCLVILKKVAQGLKVNRDNCEKSMTPEIFAADEAINLVRVGLPFREAYMEVIKNLELMSEHNPKGNILAKKHIGAPGNLNLNKLKKQVSFELEEVKKVSKHFELMIEKLLA